LQLRQVNLHQQRKLRMMLYQTKSSPTGQNQYNNLNSSSEVFNVPQNNVNIPNEVPTHFFMWEPKSNVLTPMDASTIKFDAMTGLAIAPEGYTAIYTQAPVLPSVSLVSSALTASSTDSGNTQSTTLDRSRDITPEPKTTEAHTSKPKRKFPHRSKQIRIKEVHDEVALYFHAKGLYAHSETEVLRGDDTCRVHVKTYQGLNKILDVLKEVCEHPKVTLQRIATPISMKNRYQQKGFIVYMKLASVSQVPIVQGIFEKYKDLYKKCDVAKPKATVDSTKMYTIPIKSVSTTKSTSLTNNKSNNKIITCNISSSMMPRAMAKQASVGA